MADWPEYARVQGDGYRARVAPTVRRTGFEDGGVRQARAFTTAFTVRQVLAHLDTDADYVAFLAWAATNAHTWFTWRDPEDAVQRRARVVGGAGGIEYQAFAKTDRTRRWEARLTLEGLRSDTA